MRQPLKTSAQAVSILLSACLLSACLTGGEDHPATASLVPLAPTPGAVLYDHAAALRPLRNDAVWTYRVRDFVSNTVSENIVRHQGQAGATIELQSLDQASRITLALSSGGEVLQQGAITLPWLGHAIEIDAVELRSPVRLNEQWTLFDGPVDDIGADLDGDQIHDGARVGIYNVVVGNEDVTLPDKPALRALRIDRHVAVALRLSTGAQVAATERIVSTWYAPGIGPVRKALRSDVAGRALDQDHLLTAWDGVTEGLGYLARGLVFPAGTGALSGTPLPPQLLALGLDDGALVLTTAGDGFAMHRLDRRGALLSTQLHAAAAMFSQATTFLRLRSGPRLVSYSSMGLELHAFTVDGKLVGDAPVLRLPSGKIAAAEDDTAVWLSWSALNPPDKDGFSTSALMLQRFGEDGQALTAPVQVSSVSVLGGGGLRLTSLAASLSAAVLTFAGNHGIGSYAAMVDNQGAVLMSGKPLPLPYPAHVATADASNQWILWWELVSFDDQRSRPHGVRLDSTGSFVLDATGVLEAQSLAALGDDALAVWPYLEGFAASKGHLVGASITEGQKFWPEDATSSRWLTLHDLDATAEVVSTGARRVARVRVPSAGVFTVAPVRPPILFSDRALLLAEKDGQLQSIVVWRR